MRGFRVLRVASLAGLVLLATCDDQQQLFDPTAPPFQIADAAHAGHNLDFFFLPPLVPDPSGHLAFDDGGFDGGQSPVVEICQLDGEICDASQPDDFPVTYSMTDGVGSEVVRVSVPDEHYLVNWHTNEFTLDTGVTYRIIVSVAGTELGSADVDVVSSGKELKNVDTDHYIALKDGRTLPIKFRIEHGAVHVVDAAGGTVTAVDGGVTLDLAADAVSRPVGITVMPASDYPPHEAMVPGTAFDLGPDGQTFAGQVFLTIAYDEAQFTGTDETSLRIHKAVGETWEPVPDGIVDLEANTATVRLDGFSTYSVIQRGLRPIPSEYRIFFQSIRTGNWDIYAQAPDGDPYPVIDDAGNDIHPAVSPDGNWLAFANRGGSGELYVSHVSGTDVRQVTSNFGVVRLPAWSPDGTQLAFAAFADGVGDVYVINADGSGEPVNLTADNPTDDSHPDWSPDGRQIVFTSNRDGNYDLYVTAADGTTTPWKVDPDYEYDALDPTWAPDGMWTAFVSHEYGQEDILKHIDLWGAVRLRLTHADAMDWNAQWSPNGEHIVFSSRRDGNAEIYVMNADGSGQTNLTNHPAADSRPVWGVVLPPDSTIVGPEGGVFVAQEGRVTLDFPAGALSEDLPVTAQPSFVFPENITTAPGSVFDFGPEGIEFALPVTLTLTYDPATIPAGMAEQSLLLGHVVDGVWILMETQVNTVDQTVSGPIVGFSTYGILAPTTPALSASLAFTSNRDGDHEIYTTDGVVEQQITDNSVDDRYPDWLGDQMVFVRDGDIHTVPSEGGTATNLTNTPGVHETVPNWSPDGTSIVFVRVMPDGYDVWVMNADGSNQTNLTNAPGDDAGPVWSPDGSTIAFHRDRDDDSEVYIMNADGSDPTNLTNDPDLDDSGPAWSPDGSKIVYAKYETGGEGDLWIMDPSGPSHENLTKGAFGLATATAWSPDGTQIAFTMWGRPPSRNHDVWVIAADGSTAGPAATNTDATVGSPAWQRPATGVETTALEVELRYFDPDVGYEVPPSATGASYSIEHALLSDPPSPEVPPATLWLGPIVDSRTTLGVAPGEYDVHLYYAGSRSGAFDPSPVDLVDQPEGVVLASGAVARASFDLTDWVGVITGRIEINGQPPGPIPDAASEFSLCAQVGDGFEVKGRLCVELPGNGDFRLLLPTGPGTADVCYTSAVSESQCAAEQVLGTTAFNVGAGQTTSLPKFDVGATRLEVELRYFDPDVGYEVPPSATGASYSIEHALLSDPPSPEVPPATLWLGPIVDSRTTLGVAPGEYDVHLYYAGSRSGAFDPSPVDLVDQPEGVVLASGAVARASFDLTDWVGVITGRIEINGQPPGPIPDAASEFSLCAQVGDGFEVKGRLCVELPGNGDFRLLLPTGPGTADVCYTSAVSESQCAAEQVLGTTAFNVGAGQTTSLPKFDVGATRLEVELRYFDPDVGYEVPPSATGASYSIEHALLSDPPSPEVPPATLWLGPIVDSRTTLGVAPGEYDVHLYYAGSRSGAFDPSPVDLVDQPEGVVLASGAVARASFDLTDWVGVITGRIEINGQPPGPIPDAASEFSLCAQVGDGFEVKGRLCVELPGNGDFRLLLPTGPGTADVCYTSAVSESQCAAEQVLDTISFDVWAGETIQVRTGN